MPPSLKRGRGAPPRLLLLKFNSNESNVLLLDSSSKFAHLTASLLCLTNLVVANRGCMGPSYREWSGQYDHHLLGHPM